MECSWFSGTTVAVTTSSMVESSAVAALVESSLADVRVRAGIAYALVEPGRPDPALLDRVRAVLDGFDPGRAGLPDTGRCHEFAVRYDGADLDAVARDLGIGADDVVAHHLGTHWRVLMLGFAPGFGYLAAVDPPIDWSTVPRLATPRRAVPPGAVGVAAGMSCVYPAGMPGGWPLIGRTDARLFDAGAEDDPALLHPGDRVRFVAVEGP